MAYDLPEGAQGLTPKSLIEDLQALAPNSIDPKTMFGLVQAALDPDERKFFKARLGTDSYEMTDYMNPSGRFDRARKDRESVQNFIMQQGLSLMNPALPTQQEAGQYGVPLSPYPGSQLPARTFDITQRQPREDQTFSNPDQRQDSMNIGPPDMDPFPRTLTVPGGPNPQALLRPTQAAYLAATMQGTGRGRQPQQIPAGLQEFTQLVEAETAAQTTEKGRPLTPREHADIVAFATKQFSPGARPGTPEGQVAKVAGVGAQKKFDAEVAAIFARANQDNADAKSITDQLAGRIEETTARIALLKTQAGTVGQKAAIADEMANLAQAKSALMTLKYLGAKGDLSTESENLLTKTILELLSPNLTATPKEPALLPSLFGATQGSGVDITKNPNAVPRPTPGTSVVPPPINLTNPAEENLKLLKKLQNEYPGYDVKILPDGTQLKKKKT